LKFRGTSISAHHSDIGYQQHFVVSVAIFR